MYHLIEHIRRIAIFFERYELYKILDKVAHNYRRANPQILIPSKYDIPSLIWPPPFEKVKFCAVLVKQQNFFGGHPNV